jgi:hypothetical protein
VVCYLGGNWIVVKSIIIWRVSMFQFSGLLATLEWNPAIHPFNVLKCKSQTATVISAAQIVQDSLWVAVELAQTESFRRLG